MAVDILAELREASGFANIGNTPVALSSMRKVLRELDRRLRPKPSPINESETNSPEDLEWERTSQVFTLCQRAALDLGASQPDITGAIKTLDEAILAVQAAADQPL